MFIIYSIRKTNFRESQKCNWKFFSEVVIIYSKESESRLFSHLFLSRVRKDSERKFLFSKQKHFPPPPPPQKKNFIFFINFQKISKPPVYSHSPRLFGTLIQKLTIGRWRLFGTQWINKFMHCSLGGHTLSPNCESRHKKLKGTQNYEGFRFHFFVVVVRSI